MDDHRQQENAQFMDQQTDGPAPVPLPPKTLAHRPVPTHPIWYTTDNLLTVFARLSVSLFLL
jgi:hypothetical protein